MGFDEPELMVDAARDLREKVRDICVPDRGGLADRIAGGLAKRRQAPVVRFDSLSADIFR
jgi:hypothetical protein